jgi:hypothetical protein
MNTRSLSYLLVRVGKHKGCDSALLFYRKKSMLTQERLKCVLLYDKTNGCFTWIGAMKNYKQYGSIAGTTKASGYRQIKVDGMFYLAHRLAWLYEFGVIPDHQIDHIDGDKSNNSISNLRDVTSAVNHQNKKAARTDNATGLLGVCKKRNKYRAQICIEGRVMQIGVYETAQLAHEAYIAVKRVIHADGNTI